MKSWKPLFAAAAILGAAGCGDDTPGRGVALAATTDLAEIVCEAAHECCNEGEIDWFLSPYLTAEDCAERLVGVSEFDSWDGAGTDEWLSVTVRGIDFELPNLAALDRAIAEGRIQIDRTKLADCQDLLQTTECNPAEVDVDWCTLTGPSTPSACDEDELLVGLVGEGGACDDQFAGLECADGLVCIMYGGELMVKDAGAAGTCQRQRALGEACFYDFQCEDDLYCSQLDGTCQVPRALNESCQYSTDAEFPSQAELLIECESHLTCSPFTDTCVALCSEGFRCNYDEDCGEDTGLVCIGGYCDQPRDPGAACKESDDCVDTAACVDSTPLDHLPGSCVALAGTGTECLAHDECASGYCAGTCQPTVALGAACVADAQCGANDCQEPALCGATLACTGGRTCSNGADATNQSACSRVCVALLADGQTCTFDDECASDLCVYDDGDVNPGVCGSAPFLDGERCMYDSQCESGLCNNGADDAVCIPAPLANGADCGESEDCQSLVCHLGMCQAGLPVGSSCGLGTAPCDPFTAFCDTENTEGAVCTDIKETGESCVRDIECRGYAPGGTTECTVRWGRKMCRAAATAEGLICGDEPYSIPAAPPVIIAEL